MPQDQQFYVFDQAGQAQPKPWSSPGNLLGFPPGKIKKPRSEPRSIHFQQKEKAT